MGRFEAHTELPCIARLEISPMSACHPISWLPFVPSKINPLRHHDTGRCIDLQRRLNLKSESDTARALLRQGRNDPRKHEFFALDQRIESVLSLPKTTGIDKRQSQAQRYQSTQETVCELRIFGTQPPRDPSN